MIQVGKIGGLGVSVCVCVQPRRFRKMYDLRIDNALFGYATPLWAKPIVNSQSLNRKSFYVQIPETFLQRYDFFLYFAIFFRILVAEKRLIFFQFLTFSILFCDESLVITGGSSNLKQKIKEYSLDFETAKDAKKNGLSEKNLQDSEKSRIFAKKFQIPKKEN